LGVALLLIAAPAAASPVSSISADLFSPVVDLVDPVVDELEPVVDELEPVVEPVVDLVDPVLDPVEEVVDPVLDPVEEVVDPVLDPVEEVVDPVLDPVDEVVDPVLDPVEEIVDPVGEVVDPHPGVVDPGDDRGNPVEEAPSPSPGSAPAPVGAVVTTGVSDQGAAGSPATGGLAGTAAALLPSPQPEVVLSPLVAGSLLADILDWVGRFDVGSILAAPFLALRVLLRALLSAGKGLLAPAVLLAGFAYLMARDRRLSGTKSP
jgi:hypothetical protein